MKPGFIFLAKGWRRRRGQSGHKLLIKINSLITISCQVGTNWVCGSWAYSGPTFVSSAWVRSQLSHKRRVLRLQVSLGLGTDFLDPWRCNSISFTNKLKNNRSHWALWAEDSPSWRVWGWAGTASLGESGSLQAELFSYCWHWGQT